MADTAVIPVITDPEAAELVTQLGLHAELEAMLKHARQTIPGLLRLHVTFAEPYDTGLDPAILIEAVRDASSSPPLTYEILDQISRWRISTFSPNVLQYMTMLVYDEKQNHGG